MRLAGLRSRGVRPGNHVTIFLPNIPQCVVAVYAVILIGNMVHPLSTTGENGYAVDLIASKYVLTCEINEDICSGMDVEIIRCRTPAYFPRIPKGYLMAWVYRRAVRKYLNGENVRQITEWDELLADGRADIAVHGIPVDHTVTQETAVIMYTSGGGERGYALQQAGLRRCRRHHQGG